MFFSFLSNFLSSLWKRPIKPNRRQSTKTLKAELNCSSSIKSFKKSCPQPIMSHVSIHCWSIDGTIENELTQRKRLKLNYCTQLNFAVKYESAKWLHAQYCYLLLVFWKYFGAVEQHLRQICQYFPVFC